MTPAGTPPPAAPGGPRCLVVLGPTASGKTALAVRLARRLGGEIVSADSRQVYRGLDLGTGKDLAEYGTGAGRVPCHLIDIVDPTEDYHVFRYLADARQALREIAERGRVPIVAGGSSLYIRALLDGYRLAGGGVDPDLRRRLEGLSDPELLECLQREAPDLADRVDRRHRHRLLRALEIARSRHGPEPGSDPGLRLDALLLAPYYPRPRMHARIESRLDARLAAGLVAEVAGLHAGGLSWERLEWFGLEYRFVARLLQGHLDPVPMRAGLLAGIRRFCRAQDVWCRKLEREGHPIHWLPEGDPDQAEALARGFLAGAAVPPPALRLNDILYGRRTQ